MLLLCVGCGHGDKTCASLVGSAWSPSVAGAASHRADVSVAQTTVRAAGPILAMDQPAPAADEISVAIDMNEDLGPQGSLSLVAQVTDFPTDLQGSAYPLLVSLSDGTHDLVNLTRAGQPGDCAAAGYFSCDYGTGLCELNPGCHPEAPSAYLDGLQWEQHQITTGLAASGRNSPSVNTFPTCNWDGGIPPTQAVALGQNARLDPDCAFNRELFPKDVAGPPRLRYGVTYVARYVLVSDHYAHTLPARRAGIEVSVVKKTDPGTTRGGTLDLHVILVGNDVINASRTPKGGRNLDTLVAEVVAELGQAGAGIRLGQVQATEWQCADGGDDFANLAASDVGTMFARGSARIRSARPAVNIFLTNAIAGSDSSDFTMFGYDGAIGAPYLDGTASSGLAVSTLGSLASFNPQCAAGADTCPAAAQTKEFHDLGVTIAHEIGHALGLSHLAEPGGKIQDSIDDTPACTTTEHVQLSAGGHFGDVLTVNSCLNKDRSRASVSAPSCIETCTAYDGHAGVYCPQAAECAFNHLMWWTTVKGFDEGTAAGDGNLISPHSGAVIQYSPFIQ